MQHIVMPQLVTADSAKSESRFEGGTGRERLTDTPNPNRRAGKLDSKCTDGLDSHVGVVKTRQGPSPLVRRQVKLLRRGFPVSSKPTHNPPVFLTHLV